MNEIIQLIQLGVSILIIPVLTYVVRMEKRITRVETFIEITYADVYKKGGVKQ